MNDELDRIAALVEDSRLWRAVAWPLTAAAAAWHSSLIAHAYRSCVATLSSWPQAKRVRFGAMTIGFAAAVHAAILQVVPPYARPGIPLWWLAVVIAAAMLAAACAEAIIAAWPGSAIAKLRGER